MRTRSKAFTLVETLVVVAIVMILATMLFALSGAATGRAKHTVCASNLRQLGTAMHIYAEDYDGLLPPATTAEEVFDQRRAAPRDELRRSPQVLREALHPYAPTDAIWYCPTDRYARKDVLWLGQRHFLTSYSYLPVMDQLSWPPVRPVTMDTASEKRNVLLSDAVGLLKQPSDLGTEAAFPDMDGMVHSNHPDFMANVVRYDLSLTRQNAEHVFVAPGSRR